MSRIISELGKVKYFMRLWPKKVKSFKSQIVFRHSLMRVTVKSNLKEKKRKKDR